MNATIYLLLNALPAQAGDCAYLNQGVRLKFEQLERQTTANETVLVNLLDTEKKCETRGAELSRGLASSTQGDACAVQGEYSRLSSELEALGTKCTDNLSHLHGVERGVRVEFEAAETDLLAALAFMEKDYFLVRACGREIEETKKLRREFAALDVRIASVETRARDGVSSYGKFQARTGNLSQETGDRAERCRLLRTAAVLAPAQAQAAGGALVLVPAGTSPRAASDVTGLEPEARLGGGATERATLKGSTATATMVEFLAGIEAAPAHAARAEAVRAERTATQASSAVKPLAAPESFGALFFGELPVSESRAPEFRSAPAAPAAEAAAGEASGDVSPSHTSAPNLIAAAEATLPRPRPVSLPAASPDEQTLSDRNASLFRRVSARYRSVQAAMLVGSGRVRIAGR